jgi:hypothetical protein
VIVKLLDNDNDNDKAETGPSQATKNPGAFRHPGCAQ